VRAGRTAIVAHPAIPIDSRVLEAAGRSLADVANLGVGYDKIDLDTARRLERARRQHTERARIGHCSEARREARLGAEDVISVIDGREPPAAVV